MGRPPLSNIVVNREDPSPSISYYVIYGQPLTNLYEFQLRAPSDNTSIQRHEQLSINNIIKIEIEKSIVLESAGTHIV